jgi:hypothetical protein
MSIKNKIKTALVGVGISVTGVVSAANTCPVEVQLPNNEVSQHIKGLINSYNDTELKNIDIDLPKMTTGNSAIELFTGGFKFVDAIELKQYQKTLAYASKLNLGQLRAYAQGILDYHTQVLPNNNLSKQLNAFAHGIVNYYNLVLKVAYDKPLTANEEDIISNSNYPISAMANDFKKQLTEKTDQLKNKETLRQADQLIFDQAMDERTIKEDQVILENSTSFEKSIDEVYSDNKTHINRFDNKLGNVAYEFFKIINDQQLRMLIEIDQQLRTLNTALTGKNYRGCQ